MSRKFRLGLSLANWERKALIRFAFLLPLAWIGLRVLGFNRMHRICMSPMPQVHCQHTASQISQHRAQRYAGLMAIAARHGLYKANCLHQAMSLCWLLRRQGLPVVLKIGVHNQPQSFQAHAWVELGGIPLGQDVAVYVPFAMAAGPCSHAEQGRGNCAS